ncbi:BCCT family transporter [Parvularcula sp. LCG005]|uniref:BCCT family transporter n=1 Tax=Parvularcula sp. LCG005 TaxID=3078805 RepID=UPI002941F6DD|nr:BCCT family transporter [Parvularcula sp. LCG005]WOI52842.1 BCCT family transporter [Parvularcula sp. LCG005]
MAFTSSCSAQTVNDRRIRRFIPHLLVGIIACLSIAAPQQAAGFVQGLSGQFLVTFDWLTLAIATGAVLFFAGVALSPIGNRRLGGPEARPEFHLVTWLAMLFAAGMGAGLVFWGAAEPLMHTLTPPPDGPSAGTAAARHDALAITQFHWSIHAWSIYAVAALAIGMNVTPDRPPLPSAPFTQLRSRGRRLIDWIAVLAVIFGIVASLGQGILQMGTGTQRLTGWGADHPIVIQLTLLGTLTIAYVLSASQGLRRGIAVLSNINMAIAVGLAVFVLAAGPTADILRTLVESLMAYGEDFISLSTSLRAPEAAREWTRDWSLTYFLWWVAWTPFVGVFIARISRGRTVRTFMTGVVLVPSVVTLIWFAVFGGTALSLSASGADLGVTDFRTAQAATYAVLSHLPWPLLTQTIALLLVFVFVLTSADSGAYVLAMFSSAREEPPVAERIFWGLVLAAVTAGALLSAQGQNATRALAVSGSIPLAFLLCAQAIAVLAQMIRRDDGSRQAQRRR